MQNKLTESTGQSGFRAGCSCIDNFFTLKNVSEKRAACGRATHFTFVDLYKAFNSIPLGKLWENMETAHINTVYVNTVKVL